MTKGGEKYYVSCLLHAERGRPVEADVVPLPLGGYHVRCKTCLEFGKQILAAAKKEVESNERKLAKQIPAASMVQPLFCVGCGECAPNPIDGAREYKCKACQDKGVAWPSPTPAVKPGSAPPMAIG